MGKRYNIILVACIAVTAVALSLGIGTSYARYVSEINKTLTFEADTLVNSGSVAFTSQNGWEAAENGQKINFTLSGENRHNSPKRICVRITATDGFDPNAVISLAVGETVYTAKPSSIVKDSALYKKMGAGTLFRFYDGESELSFDLAEQKDMTLSVGGASDTALVTLCIDEI